MELEDIKFDEDIEFDERVMVDALKKSSSYEDFRVHHDLANCECIITKDEYEHFKKMYRNRWHIDDDFV